MVFVLILLNPLQTFWSWLFSLEWSWCLPVHFHWFSALQLWYVISIIKSLCCLASLCLLLWCNSVNLWTMRTEQCYWNQSRCIEVVSHVEKTCPPCCSYNWSMVEHIPGTSWTFEFHYLWVVGICMPWFTLKFVFSSWSWWQYAPTACFSFVCMTRRGNGGLSQD